MAGKRPDAIAMVRHRYRGMQNDARVLNSVLFAGFANS